MSDDGILQDAPQQGAGRLTKIIMWITSETEIPFHHRKFFAIILSLCAIVFGCLYLRWNPVTYWFHPLFFLKPKTTHFLVPGALHAVCGIIMCAPLYCREIIHGKSLSRYFFITFILNIALLTVLAQFILGPADSVRFNVTSYILILAIVILWVGMRSIAGLAWATVFGLGVYSILISNNEMGHWGLLFVFCSFLSLFLEANLLPNDFAHLIWTEFRGIIESKQSDSIKASIHAHFE